MMGMSTREMKVRGERPWSFVMDYVVVRVWPGRGVHIRTTTVVRLPPGVEAATQWKGYG
jgi:hypothetical protein